MHLSLTLHHLLPLAGGGQYSIARREETGFLARPAQQTRGNDRTTAPVLGLSFSRAWLPRAKNPGLFPRWASGGKIDSLHMRLPCWSGGGIGFSSVRGGSQTHEKLLCRDTLAFGAVKSAVLAGLEYPSL